MDSESAKIDWKEDSDSQDSGTTDRFDLSDSDDNKSEKCTKKGIFFFSITFFYLFIRLKNKNCTGRKLFVEQNVFVQVD